MLQIWVLGQFDVHVDGKRVVIPSRAAQSLLAFLVLNPGAPHRREKLAGMLWPEMSDEDARRNLRRELWRVRKSITSQEFPDSPKSPSRAGENIVAEELTIAFVPGKDYWLDLAQLELVPSGDDSTSDLIGRLALYRGELLPGFYDEWAILERERVQSLFESRMQQLLERLIAEQRWSSTVEWAERWIALGQTPEPAYRALMVAHGALGDTSKVALDYERCLEAMRSDLGVEPSTETRALYETLARGQKTAAKIATPLPTVFVQPSGTVTFLFTDIEGSTRLLERLGNDYARLLADQRDLLLAAAEGHNGYEIDTQGDAFFFAFFRAADAVAFAAEAQHKLAAHPWPQNATLRVRMGLHTGEPMLASTGYVGMDVHRAARIGAAGHGGQVLMSRTTRDLIENDLPQGTRLDDLGEYKLKDLRYPVHIVQLTMTDLPSNFPPLKTLAGADEPPAAGSPPFKGLQYFEERDADIFFGREPLTARLIQPLSESPILAVVGASGSGKSSIVRAGLIPALGKREPLADGTLPPQGSSDWRVYVLTPTARPLEALATALTRTSDSVAATARLLDDLGQDPRSLYLYLRRMTEDERLTATAISTASHPSSVLRHVLLVIDQFEELFTLCRDELDREQFVDSLLATVGPHSVGLVNLIITIRADFYAALAQYPDLRDAVASSQVYIGPMSPEEMRRAIEEPAKRAGWEFEPGLVDLLLRDVGDEPGALPLLSHALLETWKRRSGHTLTLKGYADAGGVRSAIAQTAESLYQSLSPEEQITARNIFLRLTELGEGTEDTRRRASIGELVTRKEDAEQVRRVLTKLADARLVMTGEDTAEVVHEALIREWPTLRDWLAQDREGLRLHRHLTEAAQEWELLERDPGSLYRGARLAQSKEWAAANPDTPNESERAFLQASLDQAEHEERERERQRQRELEAARKLAEEQKRRADESGQAAKELGRRARYLASAFGLALILAVLAVFFSNQANQNAVMAEQNSQTALQARATAVANADLAQKSKFEADTQRDAAQKAQIEAVNQQRLATSRELAAASLSNLDVDPERSILLALRAVATTYSVDQTVSPQADDALHRAVLASHARLTLVGHTLSLSGIAYSPDGSRIATASQDGTAKVWDATTGKELLTLQEPGKTDSVNALAYSPDGSRIATASDDKTVKIWDAETGRELNLLSGHSDCVSQVAYGPDGTRLASAGCDNAVKMWDADSGKELYTLPNSVTLAFSPDGRRFVTAGEDYVVAVRDVSTGRELEEMKGHTGTVIGLTISPDGTRVASVSEDGTAKVWEAETGTQLLSVNLSGAGLAIAFSPDGKQLATSGFDGTATVWDAVSGKSLLTLYGHSSAVYGVAFNPDGTRLATAGRDNTAKVWDITPSREFLTFEAAASGRSVKSIAYSPDGSRLATAGSDNTARIWDAGSGKLLQSLAGHKDIVTAVAFSRDGTRLATASDDKTARIWDAASGKELLSLTGHQERVTSVAFNADGTRLATASDDKTAKIWDAVSGKLLFTMSGHSKAITAMAFSQDGRLLAAAGLDHPVIVWDASSGQQLVTFSTSQRVSFALAFNPDGRHLVVTFVDGTMKLMDLGADARQAQILSDLAAHTGFIKAVTFSPDGTRFATASDDNTAKIWDANTGQEILTLLGQTGGVNAATFSPDGRYVATGGGDGTVRIYLLKIDDLVALARTRLTRTWTAAECIKFLHLDQCPPTP